MMILEKNTEWIKVARRVEVIMSKASGEMVRIDTWEEFEKRIHPDFLYISTKGLELTKGKCLDCEKKAVGTVSMFRPVCGEHIGFPRMVIKEALKK